MSLDDKMIPFVQVDFSISRQEATAEGTASKFMESSTFMMGSRQWKLHCYPTGMNDHQWMDVPDGIVVVLISLHKSQMVRASLLL
jgi:hypothetical protein